ncbi:competence protein ComK [Sporosarcina gallistercoris]|uniref:Competence protein ComK n=1 Tax=Sporosarcina gallistercoris TaxID=2762245 RepID=A0ABR8PM33_9BACL|nr:competence protein ComK [Sporosarcina gallistercoris]MBD7909242.1 competence protein ComK [Sporosarcina gallistercoris]
MLKTTNKYMITTETCVIFPYFNECGRLLSMILEGDQIIIVESTPTKIVDYNLRLSGSSLKGAIDCADEILGSRTYPPVAISKKHGIYMAPTYSPKNPECAWVAIEHVYEYKNNEDGQVMVVLNNGSRVVLPISCTVFENRYLRTCKLQYKIELNTNQVMKVREKYTQSYVIKRNGKGVNYSEE